MVKMYPITVAMAAPAAPRSIVEIKSGSSRIFTMAPPIVLIIDSFANPSVRRRLVWTKEFTMTGAPMASQM